MALDNLHDRFFKETFSRRRVVAALIDELLPDPLRQHLRRDTLELSNASFVDEDLGEHWADLVYECEYNAGQPLRVALLLEHKSYRHERPHFQLLRYLMNAWQADLKQKRPPRPVIPIVIYHGAATWTYAPLSSYFEGIDDTLRAYLPEFRYELLDVSRFSDEQLLHLRDGFLALSAFLLKYSRIQDFLAQTIDTFAALLQNPETTTDEGFLNTVFVYVYKSGDLTADEIVAIFRQASQPITETLMTTAEQLRAEGREQGLRAGHQEGKLEAELRAIRAFLGLNMSIPAIASALELSEDEVRQRIELVREKD